MFTYEVRLAPKPGNPGGNLTTEVRAYSDTQARSLAAAQYPSYRVEAVRQVR